VKGKRTRRCGAAALAALLGAGLGACGSDETPTRPIETTRIEDGSDVQWDVSTQDRLNARIPGAPAGGGTPATAGDGVRVSGDQVVQQQGLDAMSAPGASDGISSVKSAVKFSAPQGWTEVAPTPVRLVNFQAGAPTVECYVTILAGDGGGPLDNVNRWRGQVGLPPVGSAEVSALPRVAMLGGEGLLIEALGAEKAILGTVSLLPGRAVFVKMIGPPELVAQEKTRFVAFCESLGLGG